MILFKCDRARVLVVDDESAARTLYAIIITETLPGLRVDVAANGEEALESFAKFRPGLIVMDMRMPVMDGLEAYHRICALCKKKRIEMPSVIFCTAYAAPETFKDIIADGQPHSLLAKPMTATDLTEAIRTSLHLP